MRYALIAAVAATATFGTSAVVSAAPKGCPPGLAKKAVPCVPPGQVKKKRAQNGDFRYNVGERIDGDYLSIRDPKRYGLKTDGTYVRSNDYVYQVDRETREVINLIGAIGAILD